MLVKRGRREIANHYGKPKTTENSKKLVFENVRAVEARGAFGPVLRFRAVLENTPGVQSS